jgi:salicylate hydroxylase
VFERAPFFEEIGAGIQLSPNATALLERLGVMAGLAGKVSEPETLAIRDASNGALLARMPLGRIARARYGSPYCTLHRADLQTALLFAAQRQSSVSLILGAEVRDVRDTETEVTFRAVGESRRAGVLLAADGAHSRIRTEHFGYAGPISFGRSAWRAVVPAKEFASHVPANEVGLWLGAGGHLVHYPVNAGASLNVVVIAAEDGPHPPNAPFGASARRVIESVRDWIASPLMGIDASQGWARGRVGLIGDAAHAIAPSAAQGGAQAVEDAWIVAQALAISPSDPAHALSRYTRTRAPRVDRVAGLASRNLNVYELSGVPAFARNFLLRVSPAMLLLSRLDWLFGWKPE